MDSVPEGAVSEDHDHGQYANQITKYWGAMDQFHPTTHLDQAGVVIFTPKPMVPLEMIATPLFGKCTP